MALVLDLFLNVPEFDRVRPRAQFYRAARYVAHEMVGEPISEEELGIHAVLPEARVTTPAPHAVRTGSRHPGGRPDLRTPQGLRLFEGLCRAARGAADVAKRAGAMRSLAAVFGTEAWPALLEIASDPNETTEVRDLAKNLAERVRREVRSGNEIGLLENRRAR
jgi:hypothetical protein